MCLSPHMANGEKVGQRLSKSMTHCVSIAIPILAPFADVRSFELMTSSTPDAGMGTSGYLFIAIWNIYNQICQTPWIRGGLTPNNVSLLSSLSKK